MRKQAGMTVLAGLFDALRRYRKEQGRLMLWYIVEFLADGRLVRIGGPEQAQYIPLIHDPGLVEYDIIVDDTPSSPNVKEQAWDVLVQLMPLLSKMPVPPQVYLELLKYSPLPSTAVAKIEQIVTQQGSPQQQNPMMQARAQMDQARAQLYGAQAQKIAHDVQMGTAQQQAENARTQVDAARAAMEAEETKARIENLRASAMANLAKAGTAQDGVMVDRYLAELEMLDRVVGWHQNAQQMAMPPQSPQGAPA
jgi:hypothetical protein